MKKVLLSLALLACVASLSACGGGGGGNEPEPQAQPAAPTPGAQPLPINDTFTLTAGEYKQAGGTDQIGYEANSRTMGSVTATPTFGKLSTFHYQDDSALDPSAKAPPPSTYIMFYGQVIANGAWTSVTVTSDTGATRTMMAADAKYTPSPVNADGTTNANTATYWSWPGNVFNFTAGHTYTVTFK